MLSTSFVISIVICIVTLIIGQRIYLFNSKRDVNKAGMVFALALAFPTFFWSLMELVNDEPSANKYYNFSQAFWHISNICILYTVTIYSGLYRYFFTKKYWWAHTFFVVAVTILIYFELGTDNPHGYVTKSDSGIWMFTLTTFEFEDYVRAIWSIMTYSAVNGLLYYSYKKEVSRYKKKRNLFIFLATAVSMTFSYAQNYILAPLGYPQFANESITILVGILLYGWAFTDWQFFQIKPDSAIEEIIENMSSLLIITNKELFVERVNKSMLKVLNRDEKGYHNQHITEVINLIEREHVISTVQGNLKKKEKFNLEISILVDGQKKEILLSIVPIFSAQKRLKGFAFLGTEVTAYKQISNSLEKQKEELENSNDALKRYAHVASHDLKEPIRTIGSFITLLDRSFKDRATESELEYMRFIKDGSSRIYNTIDAVLLFSTITNTKLMFKSVQLPKLLNGATENLHQLIKDKNAKVNIPEYPIAVKGDTSLLSLLLQNLIENGLKYNENPKPSINISYEVGPDLVSVRFEDNGIGINEEYKEKIFEMFSRLHERGKYSGTGLGLAFCRRIVDLHNGSLILESSSENGSTFKVDLPLCKESSCSELITKHLGSRLSTTT